MYRDRRSDFRPVDRGDQPSCPMDILGHPSGSRRNVARNTPDLGVFVPVRSALLYSIFARRRTSRPIRRPVDRQISDFANSKCTKCDGPTNCVRVRFAVEGIRRPA